MHRPTNALRHVRRSMTPIAMAALLSLTLTTAYAATLSLTARGRLGAGAVSTQGSCVTGPASIVPLDSTKVWSTTENFWVYPDLVVSGDFHSCTAGDIVAIAIYVPGSAPSTLAAPYALRLADITASASFVISLSTATGVPYLPATAAGTASYGLLVHS